MTTKSGANRTADVPGILRIARRGVRRGLVAALAWLNSKSRTSPSGSPTQRISREIIEFQYENVADTLDGKHRRGTSTRFPLK